METVLAVGYDVENTFMPAPDELCSNPSELALERTRQLQCTARYYYRNDEVPEFQDFLNQQNLGFWDEIAILLHDETGKYEEFLNDIVFERPGLLLSFPGIFGTQLPDTEKKQLVDIYISNYDNLKSYLGILPDLYSPTEKTELADKVLDSFELHNIAFDTACYAIVHSNKSIEEKQKLFTKSVAETQWIHQFNYLTNSPQNYQKFYWCDDGGLKRSFKTLFEQGISNPAQVSSLLQKKLDNLTNFSAGTDDHYHVKDILNAKLALNLSGLVNDAPPAELLLTEFADEVFKLNKDLPSDQFVGYVVSGIVDEAVMTGIVQGYPNYFVEEYTGRLAAMNKPGGTWPKELDVVHYDDARIQEIYDTLSQTDIPAWDYNVFSQVFQYRGQACRDKQFKILEKIFTSDSERVFNATYHLDKLSVLYGEDKEGLSNLLKQNISIKYARLDFADWNLWAGLVGYSKDDVKKLYLEDLSRQDSVFNIVQELSRGLRNDDPLLSAEETAALLQEALRTYDTRQSDATAITELCRQKLGSVLSTKYFIEFATVEFPAIANLFLDKDTMHDSLDYDDLLAVASHIDRFPWLRSPKTINRFAEKCISTFVPEHLVYILPLLWPLLNQDLRQAGLSVLLENPALTEFELDSGWLNEIKQAGIPKMISSGSSDLLPTLAPKSYATFTRRRLGLSEHDKTGKQHLLTQYAYYYDLCLRVRGLKNAAVLMPKLRGKNEEKNELRALEALVILHEVRGAKDANEIEDLTKQELEISCLTSIAKEAKVDETLHENLVSNLQKQGVDLVKFSTWMRVSFRSQKQKAYLTLFVQHLAQGGTLKEWKFETIHGNNLELINDPEILKKWQAGYKTELTFTGDQPISFNYSHDLESMYLSGSRPSTNCLHYAYGSNQRGLLGLMNADTKMIIVNNHNNKPIGNAIIRIVARQGKPSLLVEPLYHSLKTSYEVAEMNRILIKNVEQYSLYLGIPMSVIDVHLGDITKLALQLWSEQEVNETRAQIVSPKSPFTYSDSYGSGKRAIKVATVALANA